MGLKHLVSFREEHVIITNQNLVRNIITMYWVTLMLID